MTISHEHIVSGNWREPEIMRIFNNSILDRTVHLREYMQFRQGWHDSIVGTIKRDKTR